MTGGEILVECLKAQGISMIFGMPGTHNIHIYDALYRRGQGIDRVLIRHEQGAALMADGYARATGDVGVALTIPGPGASNAATGIGEAYTACVPVLLIAGGTDVKLAAKDKSKLIHGLDLMSFFEPMTKWCARADSAEGIPKLIETAFDVLRSGRPGPVVIELPNDVASSEADCDIPDRVEMERIEGDMEQIEAAADLIVRSELPIILAGRGVVTSDARDELCLLSKLLGAPVVTTRFGKGIMPEGNPPALGDMAGHVAGSALSEAETVLAIGCRFTELDTRSWSLELPEQLIQIDCDEEEIGREYPVEVGVVGDVKTVLKQLIDQLKLKGDRANRCWEPTLLRIGQKVEERTKAPILPDLRDVLERDAILSVDVTVLGYRTRSEFEIYCPRSFLFSATYAAMGYALPAALGAKLAYPQRQVVSLSGDAGFMMTCQELSTAAQYGINVVSVVINDGCLSSIMSAQNRSCDGRYIDIDIYNPDFVDLARSLGAQGMRVDKLEDLKSLLSEALQMDRPTLIEVKMDKDEIVGLT